MTYVLLALGSRGDVMPMVALAGELSGRGERATIVGLAEYAPLAARSGAGFEPISASLEEAMWLGRPWARRAMIAQPGLMYLGMRERLARSAPQVADAILRTVAPGDVVVSGLATMDAAVALASTGQVQAVAALFSPVLPSADPEATVLASVTVGASPLTRLASGAGWALSSRLSAGSGREVRRRLGLGRPWSTGPAAAVRRLPILLATSPTVTPAATEWPPGVRQTGFWTAPEPADWRPPAELCDFLDAGMPPVYVSFGTCPAADPAGDVRLFVCAARRAGQRLVVHPPSGIAVDLPEDVLRLSEVPHGWLFPRMAGVIHHGGAGTTASALRAGVPSAAVPHLGDQGYYGRRIARLGVGPAPVGRSRLTAARLANLIRAVTSGPDAVRMRARAADLGSRLSQERGTAQAVDLLQALG